MKYILLVSNKWAIYPPFYFGTRLNPPTKLKRRRERQYAQYLQQLTWKKILKFWRRWTCKEWLRPTPGHTFLHEGARSIWFWRCYKHDRFFLRRKTSVMENDEFVRNADRSDESNKQRAAVLLARAKMPARGQESMWTVWGACSSTCSSYALQKLIDDCLSYFVAPPQQTSAIVRKIALSICSAAPPSGTTCIHIFFAVTLCDA